MSEGSARHIVLCGLDRLAFRILEQLCRFGEQVVVIAGSLEEPFAGDARELGATLLAGNYRSEAVQRTAGVTAAAAIILAEDDDLANLHAALTAQELNSTLRIVIRMFNLEMGHQ